MKKVAIIQARMGSSRFPGKVLETLLDKPILAWVVNAARSIQTIDQVVVATSAAIADQAIVKWCEKEGLPVFVGNEEDVLSRYYEAASFFKADVVMRITGDCPLLDSTIAGQILHLVSQGHADYASNVMPPTWPDGLDCEAFTFKALEQAFQKAKRPSDREHVTSFIRNNQNTFKTLNVTSSIPGLQKHRWTVDTREDLEFIALLLKNSKKNATIYALLETLNNNPHIVQPSHKRNEGFDKSLNTEDVLCTNFQNSNSLLRKALKVIPLGSQTFSKSYIQYPETVSPLFLTHGHGAYVWDVDGNEFIDLVSGLLPNVLGYNDPDVNFAIHTQLQKGITFSLSTELEHQLAEKLCAIIPSAEKVRFAKNGTDATSAAVRLARAFTNRDKIIVCGYHGWQDWYIGTTTRNKGIPQAVCELSTSMPFGDLDQLETKLKTKDVAGVIMEPCNTIAPNPGYLQGVKYLCEKFGSLFILDEIVTGFRFSLGGAQAYFEVTPDISCFGKAMGNGMPISAVVGRSDVMKQMEEIFFSGTFGGEALSLAASLATIEKIKKCNVIEHLWAYGGTLSEEIEALLVNYELTNVISLRGYAPWKILQFQDHAVATAYEIKTLFVQEMIKHGVLINGSLNINFSHQASHKHKIIKAANQVFSLIAESLGDNKLAKYLQCPAIVPLFKVR